MIYYQQLPPESEPPNVKRLKPFRAVVVIEESVSPFWQEKVSKWLVDSGCYYMMAWGTECSSWHDSVDFVSILEELSEEVNSNEPVAMTSWHEGEPLKEVFSFSKNLARHPDIEIKNTLIVHISNKNQENDLLTLYENA